MKQVAQQILVISGTLTSCVFASSIAQAQISPDGTLPTNVNQINNVFEITGGRQAGSNLFHSFREFSVPNGSEAFFSNNANINNIVNIINRVTGGSISNIDGLIQENYGANLILINPSGINFGPNAQLNIGGSFLGSTASTLKFADGTEFSATNVQNSPVLTISVPVGLQFGQNPAAINIQGQGHNFTVANPIFSPVTRSDTTGLKVQPGQTLALVGGDIALDGGTLTAEAGRIELGSVAGGLVSLNSTSGGWTFGYEGVPAFGDIKFTQKALADSSGASGGMIQVQGRNLSLDNGSLLLIQNQGSQTAGAIKINTSDSVKVSGTNADATIRSSLTNETVGAGNGGDVEISTRQLVVDGGATIVAKTFSPATGGNVNVNTSEGVEVIGASNVNPSVTSSIVAATFGPGDSGNNTVSTGRLSATGGGTIASASFGSGKGGNLNVNAADSVEIIGVEPNFFAPSGLLVSLFNTGDGGDLTLSTPRLTLQDGGRVGASTSASGAAGNVTINAPEFVEVKGTVPGSINPSLIISSANLVDLSLQQLFGLPPVPTGESGDVTINTGQLRIIDGGQVTARNDGSGNAGNVKVTAGSIFLDNQGSITATSTSADVGNIDLQVQDSLQIQGNSQISASPSNTGNGGDININIMVGSLFVTDDSSVESQVPKGGVGNGGDINITGRSVFVSNDSNLTVDNRGRGDAGNINITATEDVVFDQNSSANSRVRGGVGNAGKINITAKSVTVTNDSELESDNRDGVGNAGEINITAKSVLVNNGSDIRVESQSQGNGGDININATDTVTFDSNGDAESRIRPGGVGHGGNINITTRSLYVTRGGNIRASSFGVGNAGDVNINASDKVVVDGSGSDQFGDITYSGVLSTVDSKAVGNAGNVRIRARSLSVTNGAEVSVFSAGQGDAGSLEAVAESIQLDIEGKISAATTSGEGGNIFLQTDSLKMRGGSQISAEAGGTGNGGNITITGYSPTDFVALLEGSKIIANAFEGIGGNISISTQGLFVCPECQISASSQLGVDGEVKIFTLNSNTNQEVLDLPEEIAKPEEVVAQICPAENKQGQSKFIITGRGGLPPQPSEPLSNEALVSFESSPTQAEKISGVAIATPETQLPPIARGWYINSKGAVILTASNSTATPYGSGLSSSSCHAN